MGQLFILRDNEIVSKALVDSARQDGVSVRRKVELAVVKAYIAPVAATEMQNALQKAMLTLKSIEQPMKGRRHGKKPGPGDLRRIRAAMADYEANLFEVWKTAGLARAELNMLMGRELDAEIEPDPYGINIQQSDPVTADSLADVQAVAVEARPEVVAARYDNTAATHSKMVTVGKMLPEVNLVARYHSLEGTGQMKSENEYFGGLVISWDVWAWGVDYRKMRTSKVMQKKAEADVEDAEDLVLLEVESMWIEMEEAQKMVAGALKHVEAAEKDLAAAAKRYDRRKVGIGALLKAQAAQIKAVNELTAAKVNVDAAGYSLAVARGQDLFEDGPPSR